MLLPDPVRKYFDADRANDPAALARTFTVDGVVADEGRSLAGHKAIESWWHETKAKYQHVTEPMATVQGDATLEVRARLTGRFPSSPAILTFLFRITGDHIAHLEIRA